MIFLRWIWPHLSSDFLIFQTLSFDRRGKRMISAAQGLEETVLTQLLIKLSVKNRMKLYIS